MQNDAPRLCPSCQRQVPESVEFCPFDGSPLRDSRPLPSAGSPKEPARPSLATTPGTDPFIGYALLNRYLLLERIGQGGFATVYRAQRMGTAIPVAIKLVTQSRRGDETTARRFEREGQILNAFSHPNAVGIVECGVTDEGLAYIVMQYVEGVTLRHIIANESPLALPRVEAVLLQVGAAITAAHAHGIVHRDLKPENVMIVQTSSGEVAKVLDFGVASLHSAESADGKITSNEVVVGTPRYLAPEALIDGIQTAASDVYSLGIIAYEMLTGRVPFEPSVGENTVEVAIRLARQQPPAPSGFNAQLSTDIDDVILRCITREPTDRYATPTDFAEAIATAFVDVLSSAPSTDPLSRSMPALRPSQFLEIEETIKGVPAITDEMLAKKAPPVDATVVGMPAVGAPSPDGEFSSAPATVVTMPALPSAKPTPPVAATVVGMPALPPSAPLPPAAATVVGMPALPPSAPLPSAPATVVAMPALGSPLFGQKSDADAGATVVDMPALAPALPPRTDVPATVVAMPALGYTTPPPALARDAAATVVAMQAVPRNDPAPSEQQPGPAIGAAESKPSGPILIVAVVIVLLVIIAAIYAFS